MPDGIALFFSFLSHMLVWQYRTAYLLQRPVFFHCILVIYYHDWCAAAAAVCWICTYF